MNETAHRRRKRRQLVVPDDQHLQRFELRNGVRKLLRMMGEEENHRQSTLVKEQLLESLPVSRKRRNRMKGVSREIQGFQIQELEENDRKLEQLVILQIKCLQMD